MDQETQHMYASLTSIADRINRNLIRQGKVTGNLRELLRADLRDFLVFLTIADLVVAKDEIRYINQSLDYNFNSDTMKSFAISSKVMQDDFLNTPPKSLQYFLKYGNEDFGILESKYYDIKKLYITTFQMMGEDFLSNCKHVDEKEINQLTRYRFMLESNIKSFTKNGGNAPSRPDSIPFKISSKQETTEEETEKTEIAFVGTVTGGDKSIDDLDSLLEQLESLIGLVSVKAEVKNLINLLKIVELRKQNGLKTPTVTKHFVFTGNPGTGKTTVARLLSQIYCALGILSKGHMVEVDRSGMVAAYVGQTAIKVKEVIDKAKGGVLFIDEAYSLTNETQGGDFGQEAIDTLVKGMEDNRDDLIVIVAGYPDLMDNFVKSNPGLKSRFQKTIHFPDYTADDLYHVFLRFCKENDYTLSNDAHVYLKQQLEEYVRNADEYFGNARDVRNFLNIAISAQANRLSADSNIDANELMTLKITDLAYIFDKEKQV